MECCNDSSLDGAAEDDARSAAAATSGASAGAAAAEPSALSTLPPDLARRVFGALTCPRDPEPGAPAPAAPAGACLRALQPLALTCRAWRAVARSLVTDIQLRPQTPCGSLSGFPRLRRLRFAAAPSDELARQLLLSLPAPWGRSSGSGGGAAECTDAGGGLLELLGGRAGRSSAALRAGALPLPSPPALAALTRLDVSLAPAPAAFDFDNPEPRAAARAAGAAGGGAAAARLAAVLERLPRLADLRLRGAPPAGGALRPSLPRLAALRRLAFENPDLEAAAFTYGLEALGLAPPFLWSDATQVRRGAPDPLAAPRARDHAGEAPRLPARRRERGASHEGAAPEADKGTPAGAAPCPPAPPRNPFPPPPARRSSSPCRCPPGCRPISTPSPA